MIYDRYISINLWLLLFLLFSNNIVCVERYVLTAPSYNPGFFSTFNTVLGVLEMYESSREFVGLEVDFRDRGWYYDKNKGKNWWQYYFEPIKISKGNFDSITVKEFPDGDKGRLSMLAQFDMSCKRGNELIERYIHLKPHVQKRVDSFVENNFKNYNVIGIHYRGTDKVSEAPKVPYEKVYDIVKKDSVDIKNTRIFIATDDEHFLNFMKIKFSGQIICLDSIRSRDGKPLHQSGKYNKYKLGEDAIVDCVLLSKCNKLYKTASNLSDTSVKFNPNMIFVNLSVNYGR